MFPTLFYLGKTPIGTHDAFVLLGVTAAGAFFLWEARRRGILSEQLVWIAAGSLLMGGIFAKLSTGWRYLVADPEPSVAGLWLLGGRSVLGGLAGAYLGAVLTKRLIGYSRKTGDLFAPAVALGMAIGRWGCFLTEQIGTRTSLPWGLAVDPAVGAAIPGCPQCALGVPMHPSYLYEILFHAVMFGVLLALRRRVRPEGELLKIYLAGYGLFRFGVEFVRGNPDFAWGLSGSQAFLLVTLPLLIFYFWRQWSRGAYSQIAPRLVS